MNEVHILARTYHWQPSEIFALTWRRRRSFLLLLEAEADEALFASTDGGPR